MMLDNSHENRKNKNFIWSVLMIASFASVVMGIYREGITALSPFFQRDFELSRAEVGLYIAFLYFTNTLFSIISGRLVDIKGPKWGMFFGMLFVGVLIILHSIAPSFMILLLLAALTGIGLSINVPAANKAITEWFPLKWRGTAIGIWSISFPIGGILTASLLPALAILVGWRKTILYPGILALLYGLIILRLYRDKTKEEVKLKNDKRKSISFWEGFIQLIKNIDLLTISAYGFFLGVIDGVILTHFTLFLYLDYGLSESMAGLGFALSQFGSILGRLGWGLICDRYLGANKRSTFFMMGFLFLFITLAFALFTKSLHSSISGLFFLAFLAGFFGRGGYGLYLSSVTEVVTEEQVGGAIGFSLLFLRTGMLLSPPIFGYIADIRGSYNFSWLLFGLVFFLASISQYLFYLKHSVRRQESNKGKSNIDHN